MKPPTQLLVAYTTWSVRLHELNKEKYAYIIIAMWWSVSEIFNQ